MKNFEKFLKRAWFASVSLVVMLLVSAFLFAAFVNLPYEYTPGVHAWSLGLTWMGALLSFDVGMLTVILWKDDRRYRLQRLLYAVTPFIFYAVTFLIFFTVWAPSLSSSSLVFVNRMSLVVDAFFFLCLCMGAVCSGMALMDKMQARKMDARSCWRITNTLFFMLLFFLVSFDPFAMDTTSCLFRTLGIIVGILGAFMLPISILMLIFKGWRKIFYAYNGLLFVPMLVHLVFFVDPFEKTASDPSDSGILCALVLILGAILLPFSAGIALVSLWKRWRSR